MLSKIRPLAALALVAALVFTGCAAEPAPAKPAAEKTAAETETPAPEINAGDVVTAEQVEELVASGDIIAGYPVGDELIAVQWGKPIPESVREAANVAVNAAVGSDYGVNNDLVGEDSSRLRDAIADEAAKLGGLTVAAVACAKSYDTGVNDYVPTWVISEPGPVGQYDSYQHASETAEAWQGGRQTGKRLYVLINNLGCAQ
ncbi:hypothetical protein [Microbacterium aerolatum]|uniref:hypothetical protein n=1 Tax=Microbacterium aerolatum TaxID=153731 RepID=UPI00384C6079